ncbi:MAG: peptidylprolyl isomerase [Clostridiaceae bacterium]|jgi:foldase protein PrsA|nr:peptidylprolyl isomerase [Clostridiaceae bacterium]
MKFKKILGFALCLSLAIGLCACNKSEKSPADYDSYGIVGTVGEESIYAFEFKYYLDLAKTQREEEEGIDGKSASEKKKFWNSKDNGVVRKEALIDETFNNLAELKSLLLGAKKDNYKLPQQDIDNIAESIERFIEDEGNGNKEKAEKVMKERNGVTLNEYRRMYEEFALAYFNYSTSFPYTIKVDESDIKKEYEDNKDNYDKVVVKHILISTQDQATGQSLSEEEIAQKRKLAEEILNKAKSGEDFEAMVKEYSEDPGSIEQGGQYIFGRGQMVPEFEEWSYNAKEGDMDIVQTSYGFHIMNFIRKANYEDQKNEIKSVLQKQIFEQTMEEIKQNYPLVRNEKEIEALKLFD